MEKASLYIACRRRIESLVEGETDWISILSTVSCELHNTFSYFHWTGFYRLVEEDMLKVGPYQGGHGCLVIPVGKGVCGASAKSRQTIRLGDVEEFPGHIACSSTTKSEIVVPVLNSSGQLLAVLDVDSDLPNAFDAEDQAALESICEFIGALFPDLTYTKLN